jgi:hypothetical protein
MPMTGEPPRAGPAAAAPDRLIGQLTGLLIGVTGEDASWAAAVTPDSRLELDLNLESIEWTALSDSLSAAYGDGVDLAAHVAGLGIDEILALTVGDVAAYVAARITG